MQDVASVPLYFIEGDPMTLILYSVIDFFLLIFSGWTLVYHLVFVTRLPAWMSLVFFVIFLVFAGTVLFWTECKHTWNPMASAFRSSWSFGFNSPNLSCVSLALMCMAIGMLAVVVSRPDADDFSFFHRALYQLTRLNEPFYATDTTQDISGLPPISLIHNLTSYEPGIALFSWVLKIDAIWAYQNLASSIVALMTPIAFFLLYKHFRLGNSAALWGALFAILFLLIDGNLHRSFGNFTLIRAWQGKTILVTLLVPLIMLFTLRVLARPSSKNLIRLMLASICATGLSGSGLFMVPIQVFGISLTYVVSYGISKRRLIRALKANSAIFYCLLVILIAQLYITQNPMDTSVWTKGWALANNSWLDSLNLVFENWLGIARNISILTIVPLVTLWPPHQRIVFLMPFVFIFIFANPLTGPFFLSLLTPAAYWRLAYLFPLPWCFGLIGTLRPKHLRQSSRGVRFLKFSGIGLVFFLILSVYKMSVFEGDGVYLKSPLAYKFPPDEMSFVSHVLKSELEPVSKKAILAPEPVVVVAGLIYPDLRFISSRPLQTLHIFTNVGNIEEGEERTRVQVFLSNCHSEGIPSQDFSKVFRQGIDMVVEKKCLPGERQSMKAIFQQLDIPFKRIKCDDNYCLYLPY
jgi:hypothetical protein